MWKQCSHTKLGNSREDTLNAFQSYLALGFTTQLLSKGCCNFKAKRIRHNNIDFVIVGCDFASVEHLLLIHFQNTAILRKLIRTYIRPVAAKLGQEPTVVQTFDFLNNVFEQIVQHLVGDRQTFVEA